MATYLLTWNPKRWSWGDLQHGIDEINKNGFTIGRWSVGGSKTIKTGDRLFLIRQGKEPKGIVGSGTAESNFYKYKHWDIAKSKTGQLANYVDVRFDVLLNPENEAILPRNELNNLGQMHWDAQSSGTRIPDAVANRLENLWADFLDQDRFLPTAVAEPEAVEGLKTEIKTYVRGRSRQLRDLALENSAGVCCVCEVDFKRWLDGKGVRVLQVHHRKQLAASDAPRVTKLSDLAVVCANCHSLIHMNPKKAFEVGELKKLLGLDDKNETI